MSKGREAAMDLIAKLRARDDVMKRIIVPWEHVEYPVSLDGTDLIVERALFKDGESEAYTWYEIARFSRDGLRVER